MAKEFLDKIEALNSNSANISGGWEQGFVNIREAKKSNKKYIHNLNEAVKFITDIQTGKYGSASAHYFQEAMSTSDFPLYFGDIMDRSVLAEYKAAGVNWRQLSTVSTHRDFREKKIFDFAGNDAYLDEVIKEQGEYPDSKLAEGEQTYRLYKRGRTFDISWETLINDDLGIFQKVPGWFATAAIRTEERFHTGLYADSAGPNSSLFTAPGAAVTNGNLGTGVLDVNNLGIAIASMGMMVDPNNKEPIFNKPQFLVVPPALEMAANRILNSVNLVWQVVQQATAGSDGTTRPFPTQNFLRNQLTVAVNPYLPLIDTTTGHSAWYLFASPNDAASTEMGFLRGYEAPQVFIKASDQQRVGGGAVSPLDGSFGSDEIKYKVRHILGGTQIRPATDTLGNVACYASKGTTATITKYPDNEDVVEPSA